MRFKCFEVLEKISDVERFTQVKEFSKLSETFRKRFYSFNILCDRADFKEGFKIDEFYFRDWGKNPSQLDTMELTDTLELTDRDILCTGRFRTRGTAIRNALVRQGFQRKSFYKEMIFPETFVL